VDAFRGTEHRDPPQPASSGERSAHAGSGAKPSNHRAKDAGRLLWLFYLILVAAALFSLIPDRHPSPETHGSLTSLHCIVSRDRRAHRIPKTCIADEDRFGAMG
jgi:hypothetical protein